MLVDLRNTMHVLNKLSEFEQTIAKFYEACGEQWTEDGSFWAGLSMMELQHSDNLIRIAGIVNAKPHLFEAGRPLNVVAIETTVAGIRANTEKLRKGELPKPMVLNICRDIELSILESRYVEFVKTRDVEYNTLMAQIIAQTVEHRKQIDRKIAEARTTG